MKDGRLPNNLDDAFYLNDVQNVPPKEYFKFIAGVVDGLPINVRSWHDIGCGSGEFLHYLRGIFSDLSISGSDVSSELIQVAREKYPDIQFCVEDFTTFKDLDRSQNFDVISLLGVHGRFRYVDDWLPQFISRKKPGGYGLIFDLFNSEPVDVAVSASIAESTTTKFENTYFNLVSTTTVKKKLDSMGFKANFYRFEMPFALAKQDDPFRSWTIDLADGRRMLTNGLGQLFDLYLCVVHE